MQAGKLNRYVDIQKPLIVSGIQKWTTLVRVPASVTSDGGAESARAGLEPMNVFSTTITIRYRNDVGPKMRVIFQNRVLEIISVSDPDASFRELILLCRETQT